ncbi:MAG: IS200/IS605 family transposase [Chloroflexota bacterium]|nr:IS200/IS605 family transposase [Chloroflexota bacterium]
MPYWQLFYHIVWATKKREPVLVPEVESIIHNYLRTKAIGLGATVFAVNGCADHVHVVAAIPPKIRLSKFIGQIKAVATAKFNKSGHPQAPIYWQAEYAVFSFDRKRLPNYVAYIERQKEHHAKNTVIPILERVEGQGVKMIRQKGEHYMVDNESWRQEMMVYLQPLDELGQPGLPGAVL